ncbi:MAG: histidine-type phosphatase [Bacteroidales bacterium]|nr:histidine-type phosphatase [Bacteroidales bacterium]
MTLRLYLIIVSLFLSTHVFSQQQKSREQLGGIYYAYPEPQEVVSPAPPAGFVPYYITHYGRHGSRWVTKDERYVNVFDYFSNEENLTALGKDVKKRLQIVLDNALGNGGKLTPLGARQHRGIAHRMYDAFPQIFQSGIQISARSSVYDRCIASMNAFTGELLTLNPSLRISTASDSVYMHILAASSPAYTALNRQLADREPQINIDRFIAQLFRNPKLVNNKMNLFRELHTIASDIQDVELDVSFYDIYTYEESEAIYASENYKMNARNSDCVANGGIAAANALPLWLDIVEHADSAAKLKTPSVDLRFGHDTNLFQLLSFLQMPLPYGMDDIIPMAANLQIIFYRNANNNIIIRLLHNEHNASLPIETDIWPYYRWNDVKAFYERRAERLKHIMQLHNLNTMVGTNSANTNSAGLFGKGSEEHGQTLPAVLAPNGQTFWTPQTRDSEQKCIAPFYYQDSLFMGIRGSHWIVGGCTQDYGSFTISAISGKLRTKPTTCATRFSHNSETSHPNYYSVSLPDEKLTMELTGASHSAYIRITTTADTTIHIILHNNSDRHEGRIYKSNDVVFGRNPVHRIYQGWGEYAGFDGCIAMKNSLEPVAIGSDSTSIWLTFNIKRDESLEVQLGTSFVSEMAALNNLNAEIGDKSFEQVARELTNLWVERLHCIDIYDDNTDHINQFYGALYRASFLPRELSDVDGCYPRFADGSTMHSKVKRYTDFSVWDTYRALHPLYTIIDPQLAGLFVNSIVEMGREGGWLPIFPCWNSYTAAMIGDHCSSIIADAAVKGIGGFDINEAYRLMRQNAFDIPSEKDYINGKGRRAIKSYLKYGYIPLEDNVNDAFHKQEQTSRTLEYAYDDFCVAQVAKILGKTSDYKRLTKRSLCYKYVIDPKCGFAVGCHTNGKQQTPNSYYTRQPFITEGAPCHYAWYVPHDVEGLINHTGGKNTFVARLDSMFAQNLYWHGNEPCHQMAYLFTLAGEPQLTEKWVRHIIDSEYNNTPGGLSGNDDAGQMSAWYIFSSMGFYPVCPGTTEYVRCTPLFQKITINPVGGKSYVISKHNNATNDSGNILNHSDIQKGNTFISISK